MIGEEEQRFGAGEQRGLLVVGDKGGLQFADRGGDRGGDSPSVARERQIWAAHREF